MEHLKNRHPLYLLSSVSFIVIIMTVVRAYVGACTTLLSVNVFTYKCKEVKPIFLLLFFSSAHTLE